MTDYSKLKVTELKELLKDRGIPSTGLSRKQQIVEALEANDATNAAGDAEEAEENEEEVQGVGEEAAVAAETEAEDGTGEEADATVNEGVEDKPKEPEQPMPAQDTSTQDHAPSEEPLPDTAPAITNMEKNEPLSKEPSVVNTPSRVSPAPESVSSETRKRKRRSKTPPVSQETVNKKLKSAEEEVVRLPEDALLENAPVAVDPPQQSEETKTVMPAPVSDDVMDVDETAATKAEEEPTKENSPMRTTPPPLETDPTLQTSQPTPDVGPPSNHPPTSALYIRGLVRPLQPQQLRDHLQTLSTSPDVVLETFHLDPLRTHAFAIFNHPAAATQARAALHGTVWPDEPARKPLWVDFVPAASVAGWIEAESAGGRRDAKKFEVVYTTSPNGQTIATHQEVPAQSPAAGQTGQPGQGQGVPNAPLGPRASRPSKPAADAPPPTTFTLLDQNFNSTASKPKLYWLPVSADLVDRRVRELADKTSRDWDGGKGGGGKGEAGPGEQLRRYTFEDGDKVVDNGGDIPSFRSEGGRAPGGGGRGRGRGGGFGRR